MRANHEWTRMDANREKLLLKDEVFQIVSCAIDVLITFADGLMLNYLRITGLRVAVILSFKHRKHSGKESPYKIRVDRVPS